jgi:two-component system, NtrC family, response regulator
LANYFLHRFSAELKKSIRGFTPAASAAMLRHDWRGNIRELRNLVEREVIFCKFEWLSLSDLLADAALADGKDSRKYPPLKEMERRYISKVLRAAKNNKSRAARVLGISRTTLREKLQTGQLPTS